jgi:IMP dehydrogenase
MIIKEGLTFDDLMLVPQYSMVKSRSNVDLSVELPKVLVKYNHPIIPANMATIMGYDMAKYIYLSGGLGLIHRFMPKTEQLDILKRLEKEFDKGVWQYIGFSIGIKPEEREAADLLVKNGAKILCIDIAHADSFGCIEMCHYISEKYPEILLIAGNVATGKGAERLWGAGVDVVKCGIGAGSICSTRVETGNGVPQMTAIMDVYESKKKFEELYKKKFYFISDGGASKAGDFGKALCFADMVMAGNMFSSTDQCPGEVIELNGKKYKNYDGSSTYKLSRIEGVKTLSECKGPIELIFNRIKEGIQSCCSYQGVDNLTDLKDNPMFVRITYSGWAESKPHDVNIIK